MATEEKLMLRVITVLRERGRKAVELAKKYILQEGMEFKPLQEALRYFMEEWQDVLHPALLSLACEAVGGEPDATTEVGAAIVLLAGGADVHDDIIDQSIIKGTQLTVYGKFGKDIAILTGDALLFKGVYLLHKACEPLPKNKKQMILEIIKHAFFEISSAEAKEANFRGQLDLSEQEYLNIIKKKVAAGEASTRIGAIVGNGTEKEVEILGHYGRTYGMLMAIRDEFVDMFEADELKNRAEKECLPLPILLAFKDSSKKATILQLLKEEVTEDKIEKILDLTMGLKETCDLKDMMKQLVQKEVRQITVLKKCKAVFTLLLESTLEDL
jgi:geranylgeranyl pyrophosphate synthase